MPQSTSIPSTYLCNVHSFADVLAGNVQLPDYIIEHNEINPLAATAAQSIIRNSEYISCTNADGGSYNEIAHATLALALADIQSDESPFAYAYTCGYDNGGNLTFITFNKP